MLRVHGSRGRRRRTLWLAGAVASAGSASSC